MFNLVEPLTPLQNTMKTGFFHNLTGCGLMVLIWVEGPAGPFFSRSIRCPATCFCMTGAGKNLIMALPSGSLACLARP